MHLHLSGYKSGAIIRLAALIGAAGLILLPTRARAQQGVVQPGDRSTPAAGEQGSPEGPAQPSGSAANGTDKDWDRLLSEAQEALTKWQENPQEGQGDLMEESVRLLSLYGKHSFDNKETQVLFEAAFAGLAAEAKGALSEADERELAANVEKTARLRLGYIEKPERKAQVRAKIENSLSAGQFEQCAKQCEELLRASYLRLPRVQLLLALCEANLGEYDDAKWRCLGVIESAHKSDPNAAAGAGYVAAQAMVMQGKYRSAQKMAAAVVADFPDSKWSAAAGRLSEGLRKGLAGAAELMETDEQHAAQEQAGFRAEDEQR